MPSLVDRSSSLTKLLFLMAAATASSACSSVTGPEGELAEARRLWADRGPASYTFTLTISCECLPEMTGPVAVTVQDRAVVSRVYIGTGSPVTATYADGFPSIDGLFDRIEEIIRRNPYRLDVAYDAELGYPGRVGVDYDRRHVDDEFFQQVSDLRIAEK